ncbi:MAG: DNA polymerase III subunit beta [Desulfobacterales bacterium]|nr:DNA polymerase III subunit beta [Desulfobacterales bacterium]MDZ4224708.1 DNA polymerase III subunit beta [bacterium]
MKLTINKGDILDVLGKIQGLTGRKSSLAITEAVLVKAGNGQVTLTATDLETGFEGVYPAKVESEGTIGIHARKFFEIVKDFPSEDIQIDEVENHWIEIGKDKVQYHLVGMNPDDFPEVPRLEDTNLHDFDSGILKTMIEKTVFIGGLSDDKRAHLVGVFLENLNQAGQHIVRMVSTDGSRLSTVDCFTESDLKIPLGEGIIIPKKGLSDAGKFLDGSGTVRIGVKNNNFILKKEKETIIIRLLEGTFPKYHDIIKKTGGHNIQFDKRKFLMMLKRMSILTSDSYKGALFKFEAGKLTINATNPDMGESKEDMEIEFSGKTIEVSFNPKFFTDALNMIEEDTILMNIINEEKPCIIKGENDDRFLTVIMPMKI